MRPFHRFSFRWVNSQHNLRTGRQGFSLIKVAITLNLKSHEASGARLQACKPYAPLQGSPAQGLVLAEETQHTSN